MWRVVHGIMLVVKRHGRLPGVDLRFAFTYTIRPRESWQTCTRLLHQIGRLARRLVFPGTLFKIRTVT